MTEVELRKYFEVYTDVWKFFRKYSEQSFDNDFWQSLMCDTYKLLDKHGKTTFVKDILQKTIEEIERINKN